MSYPYATGRAPVPERLQLLDQTLVMPRAWIKVEPQHRRHRMTARTRTVCFHIAIVLIGALNVIFAGMFVIPYISDYGPELVEPLLLLTFIAAWAAGTILQTPRRRRS